MEIKNIQQRLDRATRREIQASIPTQKKLEQIEHQKKVAVFNNLIISLCKQGLTVSEICSEVMELSKEFDLNPTKKVEKMCEIYGNSEGALKLARKRLNSRIIADYQNGVSIVGISLKNIEYIQRAKISRPIEYIQAVCGHVQNAAVKKNENAER